jgi:hypothetical protein
MSYKYISDGQIVDAAKKPCFVRYDTRLKLFLACKESQAQGIASHDGKTYWHLDGCEEFGVDGYETVSAVPISDEEAEAILKELDAGNVPDDGSLEEETPAETEEEIRKTAAQVLEERIAALQEQNDFLTECLLEISTVVYG